MSQNTKGSRKAPRKHQAHWKDNTRTQRQSKRREQLDKIARDAGYDGWSNYETTVIKKEVEITPR